MGPTYLNMEKLRELTKLKKFELIQIFLTLCENLEYNSNITDIDAEELIPLKMRRAFDKLKELNVIRLHEFGWMINPEYAFDGDWANYESVVKRFKNIK